MTMLTRVPESIGSTELAYISDGEKKILRRREAMRGFPGSKHSAQGIPVLADSRADIIAHAKGLGIADVPDAGVSRSEFKKFTNRLNAAKTAQRTGAVGTSGNEKGLKKFVSTPEQKARSSKFYSSDAGKAHAEKLGKPKGFGIRKPAGGGGGGSGGGGDSRDGTICEDTMGEEYDGIHPNCTLKPGYRGKGGGGGGGGGGSDHDIGAAIFDEGRLNKPILEEVVIYGPKSEIIQERLKNLIDTNSPLFKAATTKALQSMQPYGLANSSIATEAVTAAILAVAVPIAQADAQAFMNQRQLNAQMSNEFKFAQNEAYYNAFNNKLNGAIQNELRRLTEQSANWRSVLTQRGNIATTRGMSRDAAASAMRAVTPGWFI